MSGIFIEILNDTHAQNIIIIIVYRSPSLNTVQELSDHITRRIDIINREKKQFIVVGDLNIDLLKYTIHNETTNFLDKMITRNAIPKIT